MSMFERNGESNEQEHGNETEIVQRGVAGLMYRNRGEAHGKKISRIAWKLELYLLSQ